MCLVSGDLRAQMRTRNSKGPSSRPVIVRGHSLVLWERIGTAILSKAKSKGRTILKQ